MRYHFFLHYGWFFQNNGKEGWRTFMHTTVRIKVKRKKTVIDHQPTVQVNLFQKQLFLPQLTHNMTTTDCSLNHHFSTWKFQAQNMLCTQIVFCFDIQNNLCTQHVLSLEFLCTELNWWFNEQSFVILWVSWCKNKSFWQRFTCNKNITDA